jgi:hypothetical protein
MAPTAAIALYRRLSLYRADVRIRDHGHRGVAPDPADCAAIDASAQQGCCPCPSNVAFYVTVISDGSPAWGHFITEAAAMTLAALILRDRFFRHGLSTNLQYATLGVLVRQRVDRRHTHPVRRAAGPDGRGYLEMGYDLYDVHLRMEGRDCGARQRHRADNAVSARSLPRSRVSERPNEGAPTPSPLMAIHLLILAGVVVFAHHPAIFMGLFLFFLGFAHAYERYQNGCSSVRDCLSRFFWRAWRCWGDSNSGGCNRSCSQ